MRMTIQANGFEMTGALRAYTQQRLATALGWARAHMHKLIVSLSDINGPRGGVDKRCKIQVHLGNMGTAAYTAAADGADDTVAHKR
jgi:putative sigma-54 modulation protein